MTCGMERGVPRVYRGVYRGGMYTGTSSGTRTPELGTRALSGVCTVIYCFIYLFQGPPIIRGR